MKSKKRNIIMTLIIFLTLLFTVSCSDGKSPEPGYVSSDLIKDEIVSKFNSKNYTKYSYEGSLNYLALEDRLVPRTVKGTDINYTEATAEYNDKMISEYLGVPLQLSVSNWTDVKNADGVITSTLSTKYQLEAKVYAPLGGYLDTCYYYTRDNGGFYLKSFGVNKALNIQRGDYLKIAHGKWNVTIEYDVNGYLVSEKFESINAHKEDDSKTIYGYCEYVFS